LQKRESSAAESLWKGFTECSCHLWQSFLKGNAWRRNARFVQGRVGGSPNIPLFCCWPTTVRITTLHCIPFPDVLHWHSDTLSTGIANLDTLAPSP
jgi:hypothetical protein